MSVVDEAPRGGIGYVVCPLSGPFHPIPVLYHEGQMQPAIVQAVKEHLAEEHKDTP